MSFECISSDDAKSAAICKDDEPVSVNAKAAIEGFGGVEEVPQCLHAQHAGAAEGGVIDCIGARKRTRV
jgi:hypothetical protein